jgi:hypothetical protein
MPLVLFGPEWFYGYESIFAFVFAFVTLLISVLSFNTYRLTHDKRYKYFGLSFLLIAGANLIYWFFATSLLLHFSTTLSAILSKFDFAFLGYIFLFILALTLLLIVTLKVESGKVMLLLLSLATLFVLYSRQNYLKFHITAFLLLFFLAHQFYSNYLENKKENAKIVFSAFYTLTCAEVFFMLSILYSTWFYVVAYILQLVGYLTLFYLFLRLTKYGGKKRKA